LVTGLSYGGDHKVGVVALESVPPDIMHTVVISAVTAETGSEPMTPDPTTLTFTLVQAQFCTDFETLWIYNVNSPQPGNHPPYHQWSYQQSTTSWVAWDKEACSPYNGPDASALNAATRIVTATGPIELTFQHRYSWEQDTVNWDGGQVFIKVNDGDFTLLPTASFTAEGYNGSIGGSMSYTNTPDVRTGFVGKSTDYDLGTMVTSVATLGTLNVGDVVTVRFMASWDDGCAPAAPNWEITAVTIAGVGVPLAAPEQGKWAAWGTAHVATDDTGANRALHLTDPINGQQGSMVLSLGEPVTELKAHYRMLMGDGTVGQADGTSFSFGTDVADSIFGEGGSGSGVIITFNTWAGYFRGIRLTWRGQEIARVPYTPPQVFTAPAQWANVTVSLDSLGRLTYTHAGNVIFNNYQLPNFTPMTGNAKVGFGARTGGENEKNWIDDVCINDFVLGPVAATVTPASATVTEACGGPMLSAVATGSPPYFYQWSKDGVAIPGATSAFYTVPALASSTTPYVYSVQVSNLFSSASGGSSAITVDPGCGKITWTPAAPGYLTLNWAACCTRVQFTTDLLSGVWTTINATPPVTIPVPYNPGFPEMPPALFFRAAKP